MEQTTHESSEEKTLITLNEDCLIYIFEFLQLKDCVNVAKTCSRLFSVAQEYLKKYKNIEVVEYNFGTYNTSKQDFCNILSTIGDHVVSVAITPRNFDILKTIADSCTNLSSVTLNSYYKALSGPLPFRNLKKLHVLDYVFRSTDDWKNCLANNPEIENLGCFYDWDRMLLLKVLTKLENLTLHGWMDCKSNTFATFKSLHSDIASMESIGNPDVCRVPETIILPSMLKRIKFYNIQISCNVFMSIVKQLKLLEEIAMYNGKIFWEDDETETYPSTQPIVDINSSKIISLIVKELQEEDRKLKIIFQHSRQKDKQIRKYSDNLEIIIMHRPDNRTSCHSFLVQQS